MKIKKSIFLIGGIIILFLLVQSALYSCPACNRNFYNELLEQRANTLGGRELLEAIRNQKIEGLSSEFVLPDSVIFGYEFSKSSTVPAGLNQTEACTMEEKKGFFSSIKSFVVSVYNSLTGN